MMKAIVRYYELAQKAIVETSKRADRISHDLLKNQTKVQIDKLKSTNRVNPKLDKKEIVQHYADLCDEISTVFKNMMNK